MTRISRTTLQEIKVTGVIRPDPYASREPSINTYRTVGGIENCTVNLIEDLFFLMSHWGELVKVAQCLASVERGSFAGELSLRFPTDPLEDDEEPIDGIELIIMNSEAILDEAGFLGLMFRFLDVVILAGEEAGEPVCVQ